MSNADKRTIFGFDIPVGVGARSVTTGEPSTFQPVTYTPAPMPPAPQVGPEPLAPLPDLPGMPSIPDMSEVQALLEAAAIRTRNTAIATGGGAAAGALVAHFMKKSKGWGALLGAAAGLGVGWFVLPGFLQRGE